MKRVLVPMDFSTHSMMAARLGAQIARDGGGELCILHAIPAPERYLRLSDFRSSTATSDARLEQLKIDIAEATGATASTLTISEPPADGILHYAANWNADLIVMGTLGASESDRYGLGSVAARCARDARCPVLVLRADQKPRLPRGGRFQKPMVAIDFSRFAVPAIEATAMLTEAEKTIELLHVFFAPGDWQDQKELNEALANARSEQLEKLESLAGRVDSVPLAVHLRSEAAHVADQILDYVDESGTDLLVLGAHGRESNIAMLGTVADRVLRASAAPVLMLPDRVVAA
jgi:nucleotide-binding universal stress UspA family protein